MGYPVSEERGRTQGRRCWSGAADEAELTVGCGLWAGPTTEKANQPPPVCRVPRSNEQQRVAPSILNGCPTLGGTDFAHRMWLPGVTDLSKEEVGGLR
jgi:hypothetical protein